MEGKSDRFCRKARTTKETSVYAHSAFFNFQQATKPLEGQPEAAQIHALRFELYRALERAADFQTRIFTLREQVTALKAEATRATTRLAVAKADHERELQSLRDEMRTLEEQGGVLEDLCRSLLDEGQEEEEAITLPRTPVARLAANV
jgi:predicted  nucleic acid-binding Zn-ribbon protein